MGRFNLGRRPHRDSPDRRRSTCDSSARSSQSHVYGHYRIVGGGTSLLAHTAKAATRLASNTSPEPLTNIGLSLGEDAAVLGGLTLVNVSPLLALIIFLIAIAIFYYFARKVLRSIKGKMGGTRKKLDKPADRNVSVQ